MQPILSMQANVPLRMPWFGPDFSDPKAALHTKFANYLCLVWTKRFIDLLWNMPIVGRLACSEEIRNLPPRQARLILNLGALAETGPRVKNIKS